MASIKRFIKMVLQFKIPFTSTLHFGELRQRGVSEGEAVGDEVKEYFI